MDQVIVITGASRGLGLEFVRRFSSDNSNLVFALVRNPAAAKELSDLASIKENVKLLQIDINKPETFPALASTLGGLSGGRVDLLINNAGIMTGAGAEWTVGISKSTLQEWKDQLDTNVLGPVFLTIELLPLIRAGRGKKIINMTSFLAVTSWHEAQSSPLMYASYSATKAALDMANLKFHDEFKNEGMTFIALNPGWVRTDMGGEFAPLSKDDSANRCVSFIKRATTEHSGKFFSLDGNPNVVRE